MTYVLIIGCLFVVGAGGWLGWQLLRQNGRMLLRLEELEKRLDDVEFGEVGSSRGDEAQIELSANAEVGHRKSEVDQSPVTSAATRNGNERAARFGNGSLTRSKIKRDGLKAGTPAPEFRLPCLDGTERSLEGFRGRRVLLIFSDPHCGPCEALAPDLAKFHRAQTGVSVVMISRGEPKENRAKVKEHDLSFPVLLQQRWEVSRLYAMFATPMAYLIDEQGIILNDAAVGVEPILKLMAESKEAVAAA
jgi:peroxiredoxin